MAERLLVLALLGALMVAGWGALRLWRRLRLGRLRDAQPLEGLVPPGRPAVVAFSTASCAECRSRQKPALLRLEGEVGERVTVQQIDALEHPALLSRLGILTVPATVIVDARGSVRHLNLGYASERTLREQIDSLAA